jgi:16S rRNA (uracil1498-N3)-methyltransferase
MKQSGRSFLPVIAELTPLDDFIRESAMTPLRLIAHERSLGTSVSHPVLSPGSIGVSVLIGPEGGFDDEEVDECCAAGWVPFYLGDRRLRTETAAIIAVDRIIFSLNSSASLP